MKGEVTGILMLMPNQYVLFCQNHCIRNQCNTKCNLWVQEQEFMVSDVYHSHFSPALLKEFSLLWIRIQEFAHKRNANSSSDLRISIFLAHYVQKTHQEQDMRQKSICSYCIWQYQLLVNQLSDTSSVLNHGTFLCFFGSACFTLLFQWKYMKKMTITSSKSS